jgi:uncharacterized membrane protein
LAPASDFFLMNEARIADPPLFEAIVSPHRSLSRRTLVGIVCAMLAASALMSTMMALLGAWPVIGFNCGEMILAVLLFWLNARAARAREVIAIDGRAVRITRVSPGGRRSEVELPSYWTSLALEERAGTVPRLCFVQRGRRVEVGHALGEAEKRDLARVLAEALDRWRNPRFFNPQLEP